MNRIEFKLPESMKGSSDAEALEKVGQAVVDAIAKAHGEAINSTIAEKMKELADKGASKETVAELEKALKTQGSAITELKERGTHVGGNDWRNELKSFMDGDAFKAAMSDRRNIAFEFKADPTTITATNFGSAQPFALSHEVLPGINAAPREPNVVFQLLNQGNTNSRDIYWVNRSPVNGAAAFIGEGALKPQADWTYLKETSNAKKVAASTKVSTEMLRDFAYMRSEINTILNEVVFDATDNGILNGDGTGDNLKGILTNASAYVGTGLDGTVPFANTIDAIRAIVLQMRDLKQRPDTVLLNPVDKATIDLLKNDNGNYISAEAMAIVSNLTFLETLEIPAGKVVVLAKSKFPVKPYEGFRIEFGWVNDDFQKNLVTVIAELRLHSYHNSIDDSAIVYETIATVTAALNKPAA